MDNEFIDRQINNMQQQLESFDNSQIDLPWLISGLESLFNCIEELPEKMVQDFRKSWGRLEEVYSVAVVREIPWDDEQSKKLLKQATQELYGVLNDMREWNQMKR